MKRGWLEGCRRIIGLDRCLLKGVCKGQLLVVVSKEGNNQMFPIAWAVVEVENTFIWTWFLKCVRYVPGTFLQTGQKSGDDWRGEILSGDVQELLVLQELNYQLDMLDKLGDGICERLLHYRKETWCRAYFNCDKKCDIIDNNMCETFNSCIMGKRHKTIITMLEEIKIKLMNSIGKTREFYETWICDITPIAMKVYQDNLAKSMKCTPRWNG
ncbi:uncharacterized protein LOC142176306 [Nicotiana tabacum]|uniref:Uncharacterized protein LOC142176306 n=1 Tax=Nicotiana tabacum TaxID=4097 RepID=A0AC58TQP9_TOBAC